ncbi:hypothetical protein ACEWY4_019671 [Coilia grayii]|uniref:Carboxylesterase type B domain-containing protein n=1 Tax=Coilia grayii TaxID=363190 RepID=A0ABD1JDK8_9TELE
MCIQFREASVNLSKIVEMIMEIPEVSEDCLYLNVYTPAKPAEDAKLPVMVWIHGGGFAMGAASFYDGSVLAAYQNVVVVTIQYRLGMLGFFSTGDGNAPGNWGLLDQVAALQWVQENIESFGGDPSSVTIFGESAGGVSVSLQYLSPLSSGLFHRGIAESGTAAMSFLVSADPMATALMLANVSNCAGTKPHEVVDCVMQMSTEDVIKIAESVTLMFMVTVDGHFLPKPVGDLLKSHEFNKSPLINGVNNDEGGFLLAQYLAPAGWEDGIDFETIQQVPGFLIINMITSDINDVILEEYMGNGEDREKNRDGYTELLGDLMFNIPAIKVSNAHRDSGAPIYMYEFQHPPSILASKRPSFTKVDHGDEIAFVFGGCFLKAHVRINGSLTEEEDELCRTVMAYWGNFARTGSPNGPGLTQWPMYGAGEEYLGIGLKQQVGSHLKANRFSFHTQTLPRKIQEKQQRPLVHTKLGALRGEYLRVRGKTTVVHSYLGVPFAKPPVGPLRLAPPQPAEGWEGVRDATKQPYMCLQDRQLTVTFAEKLDMTIEVPDVSEDCLYLNIYTPAKPAEGAKLPVMVWMHGGAFVMGSASFYDGSVLAAYQNVVVVLVQYRLGMLGFFSTGDENAPGNWGLLDQVSALQWVQENIKSFGGDPSSVTIFGESAGGVSVSLQILSPLSTGLFHRAIAESGTAAMDLLTGIPPMASAMIVANVSNCVGSKPHQIVDCVMHMTTEDILNVIKNTRWIYGPTTDGHFLPKNVKDIFASRQFNKVPLINGINNDECGWLLPAFNAPSGWTEGMDRDTVKTFATSFFPNAEDWVIDLVMNEYLGSGEDTVKNRDGFTELYADLIFNIPAIRLSNAHRDSGAPVYMYELQHPPSILVAHRPSFVRVDHGDDIVYVFGGPFMKTHIKMNGTFTEEEDELAKTVMSYWGNFARTGSPNGPGLTHWPMYGAGEEYLGIGLKQQVASHLRANRFSFHTQTLPKKIQEKQQEQHRGEL